MAKQEGLKPLPHPAQIIHGILTGTNQVADGFILQFGNGNWNKFANPMQSR
jgi:hypothetical protein